MTPPPFPPLDRPWTVADVLQALDNLCAGPPPLRPMSAKELLFLFADLRIFPRPRRDGEEPTP